MRRRDSSGSGGRKKPSGRSGARSTGSRAGSSPRKNKSAGRDDDSKPRRPRMASGGADDAKRSFSKPPRGGKSFGRPRKEGDDSKPRRTSRFAGDRDDAKRGFSKPPRGGKSFGRTRQDGDDSKPRRTSRFSGDRDDAKRSFSKPAPGGKSFGRTRKEGDDSKPRRTSRFAGDRDDSKRSFSKPARGEKPYSRSRDEFKKPERDERQSAENAADKPAEQTGKKGFFSKISRGGKSFEKKRHDPDFGKSIKDYTTHKEEAAEASSDKIRLNKYISNSGVCSRREADELITMGLVSVNGKVITELGYKINRGDIVKYEGKTLRSEKPVYILMNKPKGYLTTTKDPQERNTVMHIIAGAVKERVYPVGRLDRNTTGLLLLTNDGALTEKLSHPSYNVKKIYKVELDKPLTKADFQKIMEGVQLEEGRAIVDDLAIVSEDGKTVGIELHIGWNRVVRRIFERLEYTVLKLDRTIYAGLDKKELPRGHWRFLTQEEIVRLKHFK
jgi:23S rRNA pseudouridine2605 synthase